MGPGHVKQTGNSAFNRVRFKRKSQKQWGFERQTLCVKPPHPAHAFSDPEHLDAAQQFTSALVPKSDDHSRFLSSERGFVSLQPLQEVSLTQGSQVAERVLEEDHCSSSRHADVDATRY